MGSTYLDTNRPDLAARHFAEAIRLDADSSSAFNSLGVALARLGKLPEAAKCFAKAVQLSPNNEDAQINLNRALNELRLHPKS